MGLYLEEFEIGKTLTTRGRTVGEGDISVFAGLVGDHNPLHVDDTPEALPGHGASRSSDSSLTTRTRPSCSSSTG